MYVNYINKYYGLDTGHVLYPIYLPTYIYQYQYETYKYIYRERSVTGGLFYFTHSIYNKYDIL